MEEHKKLDTGSVNWYIEYKWATISNIATVIIFLEACKEQKCLAHIRNLFA